MTDRVTTLKKSIIVASTTLFFGVIWLTGPRLGAEACLTTESNVTSPTGTIMKVITGDCPSYPTPEAIAISQQAAQFDVCSARLEREGKSLDVKKEIEDNKNDITKKWEAMLNKCKEQ